MFTLRKMQCTTAKRLTFFLQQRNKSKKEHWAKTRRKITSTKKALEHFDDFYQKVFKSQWPSIRIALLSPHKYCAVVNFFGDSNDTVTYLQNQGAINFKTLLEIGKTQENVKDNAVSELTPGQVSELDNTIRKVASLKQMEEAKELYPPSEEGISLSQNQFSESSVDKVQNSSDERRTVDFSLSESRKMAQIDEGRFISPSLGLSHGLLYEFVPATQLKGLEDRVLDSDHYAYYSADSDFPLKVKKEFDINYPENLNIFMYERGNVTSFDSPKKGSTGILNYYLMDGASILPVLALGIKPGDKVLDMCAAPGGKSLLMLQTLYPGRLVCNDVKPSRVSRIESVFNQFIYNLPNWKDEVLLTKSDGRIIQAEHMYDKVLVDVPCTTDRHSLHEDDNSLFSVARMKERLCLPELQSDLLKNALKLVRPGGTVVYSTCSLSPIQNDGVVQMALRNIWEETKIEVEVRDLAPALQSAKIVYKFGDDVGLRYGHLVLPFLPCNFGPLYFCKLVRVK